ncbi:hypothetical protein [Pseudonocardia sp. H11422]|uniref:hypothetical protein n=1 Tax=Pseudonocardia sp. H11422 TaxID=2835866 RepID=UPI001BDCB417|nr:hypothetical protein [Pseudonocardia sp. H11422]
MTPSEQVGMTPSEQQEPHEQGEQGELSRLAAAHVARLLAGKVGLRKVVDVARRAAETDVDETDGRARSTADPGDNC